MITKTQIKDALQVIADYENQLMNIELYEPLPHKVGAKVKLSAFGIEMQGKATGRKKGIVIEFIEGAVQKITDGYVCVKWEGVSSPSWMHISQIELL